MLLLAAKSGLAQHQKHRVIIAVTSPDESDWKLVLGNTRNILAGYAPDAAQVEIDVFGPGIKMLVKPSDVDPEIQALEARHVRFVACENTMRGHHLTLKDLVDGVQPVPSGAVELVDKQEQGWAYIKGGR